MCELFKALCASFVPQISSLGQPKSLERSVRSRITSLTLTIGLLNKPDTYLFPAIQIQRDAVPETAPSHGGSEVQSAASESASAPPLAPT